MTVKRVAKPKYKVGQVVKMIRWDGLLLGTISRIIRPSVPMKSSGFRYVLDGWMIAVSEKKLRPLTKRERG